MYQMISAAVATLMREKIGGDGNVEADNNHNYLVEVPAFYRVGQ